MNLEEGGDMRHHPPAMSVGWPALYFKLTCRFIWCKFLGFSLDDPS